LKVFQLFDEEDKGYITVDNLKNVTRELGENMTQDELAEMITRADTDDDGKVSFEDFYAIMTKKSY